MSYSEYNGNKAKVSLGKIFKHAQDSFPKIPTSQASFSSMLKTISPSGRSNAREHELLSKSTSSSKLSQSKFGFQKLRMRAAPDKKKGSNHRAELLDNQEGGDQEDSADEIDCHHQFLPMPQTALIGPPNTMTSPTAQKQERWRF